MLKQWLKMKTFPKYYAIAELTNSTAANQIAYTYRFQEVAHTSSSVSASVVATASVAASAGGGCVCVLAMSRLVLHGARQVGLQLGCTPLVAPCVAVMGTTTSRVMASATAVSVTMACASASASIAPVIAVTRSSCVGVATAASAGARGGT